MKANGVLQLSICEPKIAGRMRRQTGMMCVTCQTGVLYLVFHFKLLGTLYSKIDTSYDTEHPFTTLFKEGTQWL